jgi:lipopolysaccharide transport system ATP-binding protein
LTGVIRPTTGKIAIDGQVSAILELGMGLNPELNGYQNIRFVASTRGLPSRTIEHRMQSIVDFAEIGEYIEYPVRTYSTGMRARLAFSIATSIAPDILIIDEVLAVGDALFQRKCYQRIHELLENNTTVLLVTHDLSSVRRLCSRALLIDGGRVTADGDPKAVTREYETLVNKLDQIALAKDRVVEQDNEITDIGGPVSKPEMPAPKFVGACETSIVDRNSNEVIGQLKHGETYIIRARFVFEQKLADVSFGISIKNHKGEALCGEISPAYGSAISIASGQVLDIAWQFDALMLNGTYFLSLDVRAEGRSKSIYVAEDVTSFKVDGTPQGQYVGSFVPMSRMSIEMCQ